MNDAHPYDALVVGAGPGGATAATFMARAGLRVLLVDKARFPRDKTCGDALSGKTVDVLRRLNLVEAVEAAPQIVAWGIRFSSPYGSEVDVEFCDPATATQAAGYVMAREDFDTLVVDAARAAGAEVWEDTAVSGLVRDGTRVTGATLRRDGQDLTVNARVVVGADGAYSAVARALGFDQLDERHYCAGLRQYWEGVTDFHEHNLIELHFVDAAIPGYFWIFPMANGRANVGIGMLSSEIKKRDVRLKEVLQACIAHPRFAHRFKDARPLEKIRGYGLPLGSHPRPLSGDGWMLVGDAASLIDPFSGEGIGNAMVSGEFAAKHALLALTGSPVGGNGAASTGTPGVATAARLSGYDRDVMDYLGGELRLSHIMQRLGRRKWLLHFVIDTAARKPAIRKALSTMFEDEHARAQLKSPLFYLRALFT
jgi:menaquinone-9 beta-reductase